MQTASTARFLDALTSLYPPRERRHIHEILIIGPGYHDPCHDLLNLFPHSQLTAIDLNKNAIKRLAMISERLRCFAGDAAPILHRSSSSYDLALIRHPDINRRPSSWQKVLSVCVSKLTAKGLLLITTYTLTEARFISKAMQSLPVKSVPPAPLTTFPVCLQGTDRHILVFTQLENTPSPRL